MNDKKLFINNIK